jgi:hypothetical protein
LNDATDSELVSLKQQNPSIASYSIPKPRPSLIYEKAYSLHVGVFKSVVGIH